MIASHARLVGSANVLTARTAARARYAGEHAAPSTCVQPRVVASHAIETIAGVAAARSTRRAGRAGEHCTTATRIPTWVATRHRVGTIASICAASTAARSGHIRKRGASAAPVRDASIANIDRRSITAFRPASRASLTGVDSRNIDHAPSQPPPPESGSGIRWSIAASSTPMSILEGPSLLATSFLLASIAAPASEGASVPGTARS